MTTQVKEATRNRFGEVLSALGGENPNVVFVGGDLNKSVMSVDFSKKYPDRFFDLGAAEQNMMSVAAGLASAGKVPFVSTFACLRHVAGVRPDPGRHLAARPEREDRDDARRHRHRRGRHLGPGN